MKVTRARFNKDILLRARKTRDTVVAVAAGICARRPDVALGTGYCPSASRSASSRRSAGSMRGASIVAVRQRMSGSMSA